MRSDRSYWVITSLFTTATMRSSRSTRPCGAWSRRIACASATPLPSSASSPTQTLVQWCFIGRYFRTAARTRAHRTSVVEVDRGVLPGSGSRGIDPLIPGDAAFQGLERIGPEAREAVQLEL